MQTLCSKAITHSCTVHVKPHSEDELPEYDSKSLKLSHEESISINEPPLREGASHSDSESDF